MNFAKVFRRHHPPRETVSPIPKTSEKPSFIPHYHHQYSRPFSYHIPTTEQLSSTKPSERPGPDARIVGRCSVFDGGLS